MENEIITPEKWLENFIESTGLYKEEAIQLLKQFQQKLNSK